MKPLEAAWAAVDADALLWIATTCCAYLIGQRVQRACKGAPWANPVLVAILLVTVALVATGTDYRTYFEAVKPIHLLLGPATVALAVPLAANLAHVRRSLPALAPALIAGSFTSVVTGYAMVRLLGGDRVLALSMAPKAATTPIAMALAEQVGGAPALAAVLAILGGIVVAMVAEPLLRSFGIADPRAHGLACGLAGSGIAAAEVARQHPLAAAFAALAVGLNGLVTSLCLPLLVHMGLA